MNIDRKIPDIVRTELEFVVYSRVKDDEYRSHTEPWEKFEFRAANTIFLQRIDPSKKRNERFFGFAGL